MALWNTAPPEPRSRDENYPTLLFSWWCTGFSVVIILIRLLGRKVRSDVLFTEDRIMMVALIPLLIRMGCIHVVLLYGTNNVQTAGHHFTNTQLEQRSIGARLVLASRIFYAAFIWLSKVTVSEFLKRNFVWRRSYEMTLRGIRVFLVATFFAVVIATLTECHPFDHYWQVVPDPGPQCRQGYAQLITMGTCDVITDILLVAFPIPIVLRSGQTWKRKLQLASLFSLSAIMIVITGTRIPEVISHQGRQQYRTVWASCEILASTAVSNAVILGSFLRDKGTKKNKYQSHSVSDSIERSSERRPTMPALQQVDSDEDLFRSLGCRVPAHLRHEPETLPRPAPAALPSSNTARRDSRNMPELALLSIAELDSGSNQDSLHKSPVPGPPASPTQPTKRGVSFFDIGGLLEDGSKLPLRSSSHSSTPVRSAGSGPVALDFATPTTEQSRRGSQAHLTDIGNRLTSTLKRSGSGNGFGHQRRHSDVQLHLPQWNRNAPTDAPAPMLERFERFEARQSLPDTAGLLSNEHVPDESADVPQRINEHADEPLQAVSRRLSSRHCSPDDMNFCDPGGLLN